MCYQVLAVIIKIINQFYMIVSARYQEKCLFAIQLLYFSVHGQNIVSDK